MAVSPKPLPEFSDYPNTVRHDICIRSTGISINNATPWIIAAVIWLAVLGADFNSLVAKILSWGGALAFLLAVALVAVDHLKRWRATPATLSTAPAGVPVRLSVKVCDAPRQSIREPITDSIAAWYLVETRWLSSSESSGDTGAEWLLKKFDTTEDLVRVTDGKDIAWFDPAEVCWYGRSSNPDEKVPLSGSQPWNRWERWIWRVAPGDRLEIVGLVEAFPPHGYRLKSAMDQEKMIVCREARLQEL